MRALSALVLVFASLSFIAGCKKTVDDGKWTITWRVDGTDTDDVFTNWSNTCTKYETDKHALGLFRSSRLRTCETACSSAPAAEVGACRVRCDGKIELVKAHCTPSSHQEEVRFLP